MATIKIDFGKTSGSIKPLHAGGQPPMVSTAHFNFDIIREMGAPYSRLHDAGGNFAGNLYVDIPNIFRDFDADENDPKNYDFCFTDQLITALVDAGIEPYYRLGVTIENHCSIKSFRIDPPKDYEKWARIAEHIMAHYLEGWADGFHYQITYWEIWNEPECFSKFPNGIFNQMWTGTAEDYYRLYEVASKHLKARFPYAKIGGYASCGFYSLTDTEAAEKPHHAIIYGRQNQFFDGFFRYIREHGCPIDFFSWHSYQNTKNTIIWAKALKEKLERYGYGDLPTHLNEWNPYHMEHGTAHHGAEVAAMMLGMQYEPAVHVMCIYDMRYIAGDYAPLFDAYHRPTYAWYALAAFNKLYQLKGQAELQCDTEDLYAVAATDGKKKALMMANLTGKPQPLKIEGMDLSDAHIYVMDDVRLLSFAASVKEIPVNGVVLIEA
ncbi:MAG: hypothetical protein IK088_09615 [Lachnospiraceae bacterium]|nr:hypothetical protein [Lachnospiraceae bacterium]